MKLLMFNFPRKMHSYAKLGDSSDRSKTP